MTIYQELLNLIHEGKNPYEGYPFGRWAGHYNTDGSERPIFHQTMERIKPRLIIEVGTFLGGSALHMAKYAKAKQWDTAILCIDTWLGGVDHWLRAREKLRPHFGRASLYYYFLNNVMEAKLENYIVPFPLDSLNAARFLKEKGVKCQMVYIDGSHEQGDVRRDYEAYWELLEPKGAFMVDDLTNWFPGVLKDWDRFLSEHGLCDDRVVVKVEGEKGLIIKP